MTKRKRVRARRTQNGTNTGKSWWRNARPEAEIMQGIRKRLPPDATNIKVTERVGPSGRGGKLRVTYESAGRRQSQPIFIWDTSTQHHRVYRAGQAEPEGGQDNVIRQPDTLRIHSEEGERDITLNGSEHHIHLHTGARERPERPSLNFEMLNQELVERFEEFSRNHAVNIGLGGETERKIKGHLKDAKYQSKFRGKAGLIRDIADVRKVIKDKWKGIHPLKLADAIVSTKGKTGLISFRRTKRNVARAKRLREKYAPGFVQVFETYKAETEQALFNLMDAFEAGKINWDNYNMHMENYKKVVKKAETKFVVGRMKLMDAHNKEWRKAA